MESAERGHCETVRDQQRNRAAAAEGKELATCMIRTKNEFDEAYNNSLIQIDKLATELAAEKARADKAEARLARVEAGRDKAEAAAKYISEVLEHTATARDEARAACAEMRQLLVESPRPWTNAQSREWNERRKHAISTSCGTGWLSPEVREKVRQALLFIEDWVITGELSSAYVGSLTTRQVKGLQKALALLKGKTP